MELDRKWLLKGSDMRGTISSFFFFLLGLSTGFLYYDMSTLWGHSLCVFTKGMRGWAYENKEKVNKGKWKQREWGEWVSVRHTRRAKSVELVGSIVLNILHAGIFLLDTDMKSVLPFRSLVAIQSTRVLTQSALLQVTSLPTSISYLICLHSATRNRQQKRCQWIVTPRPDWVDQIQ
jgi:hypothetical protein